MTTQTLSDTYAELCQLIREKSYLKSTQSLLEWDQETLLPKKGGAYRANQIAFLAGEVHSRATSPRIGELLSDLESQSSQLDELQQVSVSNLQREYERNVKLPHELVTALAHASAEGQQVWVQARKENRFAAFAPKLKEIFRLKREQADALGYEECRYDALLDEFEPGAKTKEVDEVLTALKDELVPLVAKVTASAHQPDVSFLKQTYPIDAQREFGRQASEKIGFDYNRGRLDVTFHPFCAEMGPDDVRITTRYDESYFNTSFFGTLHESGHGIYEQGLLGDFYGLPPGRYCSLGIHESQSRLWENQVGRSRGFWKHFFPIAQRHFPDALGDVELKSFVAAVNHVRPSIIRVEADEATYNLHIIIRFKLEQALLNDELETDDLPEAWNSHYEGIPGGLPDKRCRRRTTRHSLERGFGWLFPYLFPGESVRQPVFRGRRSRAWQS